MGVHNGYKISLKPTPYKEDNWTGYVQLLGSSGLPVANIGQASGRTFSQVMQGIAVILSDE